jgi:acyl-CoA hydrolase
MEVPTLVIHHLIKSEDLNHHGTLFAGRSAEWFVESGFVAAATLARPENIVCLKIHGMMFKSPVSLGDIVRFDSKIILTGRSRIIVYVDVTKKDGSQVCDGFITFVHVDKDGKAVPHGIEIEAVTPEDQALQEQAKAL